MEGHITIHVSLRFAIMQCRHIFINSVLSNKYFVILNPESIHQHFNERNCQVLNLNIRLI